MEILLTVDLRKDLCISFTLSSADISITLRNIGRDAYKPEVFGQAIIIDLRITREGMRTFKLKSKSGKCEIVLEVKFQHSCWCQIVTELSATILDL